MGTQVRHSWLGSNNFPKRLVRLAVSVLLLTCNNSRTSEGIFMILDPEERIMLNLHDDDNTASSVGVAERYLEGRTCGLMKVSFQNLPAGNQKHHEKLQ
jgi:hypothetical protein